MQKHQTGLTLIELMTVLVLLAVLASTLAIYSYKDIKSRYQMKQTVGQSIHLSHSIANLRISDIGNNAWDKWNPTYIDTNNTWITLRTDGIATPIQGTHIPAEFSIKNSFDNPFQIKINKHYIQIKSKIAAGETYLLDNNLINIVGNELILTAPYAVNNNHSQSRLLLSKQLKHHYSAQYNFHNNNYNDRSNTTTNDNFVDNLRF